ncbi:MAG: hypothetical protein JXR84_26365, partial [Anaerolineae bacterium]|nr:hypothetical protein [Anaerolineae bacterium]
MVRKSKHNRYWLCRIVLALALSIPLGLVMPLTSPEPVEAGIGAWTSDGPYGGNIQDIVYSPGFAQDRTVFVATTQGVFKSTNGGDSWFRATQGISV